jgi:hypothetical protein
MIPGLLDTFGEVLREPVLDRVRDVAEIPNGTRADIAEPLIEAMSVPESGVRPQCAAGCASNPGRRFGGPHESCPQSPLPMIGANIETMRLHRLHLGEIHRNAGADPTGVIFDDPELSSPIGDGGCRCSQIGEVAVRVYETARILGEAERQQAEKILCITVFIDPALIVLKESRAAPA